PDIIHNQVIDEIIFVVPRSWLNKIEDIMYLCEAEGLRIHIAVDYFELKFSRGRLSELDRFPLLTFSSTPARLGSLVCKRIFDVLISAAILLLSLPLFVAVAILIKLTSDGPVFFKQKRVGLNGRIFRLYKFRTMVRDAELKLQELMPHNEMHGPVFKMSNDPRITPVGRVLRKFSIDELPQFWNVLTGTMSVVGPRPPLPSEVKQYDSWQRRRLSMRPGITCLWQVSGRNRIVDFAKWVKMDLDYIDEWSFWLDMKIFFKTIPVVIFGIGAK
ncbi:MAG TPA: sugar transferase, partial [Candidatus Omnitrophota bacterium]|nr:sugar transferase [Candidatus Omnitrophota bacterium]